MDDSLKIMAEKIKKENVYGLLTSIFQREIVKKLMCSIFTTANFKQQFSPHDCFYIVSARSISPRLGDKLLPLLTGIISQKISILNVLIIMNQNNSKLILHSQQ